MIRRVLKNIGALTITTIASRLVSFYVTIYLARRLALEGFGALTLAQAIISYFAVLTDLGLKNYATREIAGRLSHSRVLLHQIFSLRLLLGLLSFGLCQAAALILPLTATTLAVLSRLSFVIILGSLMIEWIFYLREEMEWVGLIEIAQNLVLVLLVLTWIKKNEDFSVAPFAYVCSTFFALLFGYLVLSFRDKLPRVDFSLRAFRKILSEALPIGLSMVLITLYYNLAQIILGFMMGERIAGLYAAAYKFVTIGILGLNILIASFYPTLVRLHRYAPEVYFSFINLLSRGLLWVGFVVGAVLSLNDDVLVELFYGIGFHEAGRVFGILIWSLALTIMRSFYENYLVLSGRQSQYLKLVLFYFLSCLVLSFIGIKSNGLQGAPIAMVLADFIFTVSMIKIMPDGILDKYLIPFLGIVLTSVALFFSHIFLKQGFFIGILALLCAIGWGSYLLYGDYFKWRQLLTKLRAAR